MTLIMKFGGAALADPQAFGMVAQIIKKKNDDTSLVVVVSAMGEMTDELISLASQVHPSPPKREQDMLISVGERISMSLLAMALDRIGISAVSLTGSQSGIITSNEHSDAKIIDVKPDRIRSYLAQKKVVIVAGFQGVSLEREITTLGRGGSDTTAVALGAALGAECVEFYKDVPGVFSTDPKKDPQARYFPAMTFDEALKLDVKVLHKRAIYMALKNILPLHVLPFDKEKFGCYRGTRIGTRETRDFHEPEYEMADTRAFQS